MSPINQRIYDDLELVKEFVEYADKAGRAGRVYESGRAYAAARDGCEALAERIGSLADALDRGEYHNSELLRLRRLALGAATLRLRLEEQVVRVERQLAA
jgi:hypothetical protein